MASVRRIGWKCEGVGLTASRMTLSLWCATESLGQSIAHSDTRLETASRSPLARFITPRLWVLSPGLRCCVIRPGVPTTILWWDERWSGRRGGWSRCLEISHIDGTLIIGGVQAKSLGPPGTSGLTQYPEAMLRLVDNWCGVGYPDGRAAPRMPRLRDM